MKTLKNYIKESLSLDMKLNETSLLDIEGTIKDNDKTIKNKIEKWIIDNFNTMYLKISNNPNKNGKYEVSAKYVCVTNRNITSLTNDLFIWKEVNGDFHCPGCSSLTSLEGAPEKVSRDFSCAYCHSLSSLEGAPKEIGGGFDCSNCDSLTSLEGAPKEVGGYFSCAYCNSLTSLESAPKNVKGHFNCSYCKSLKSLEGAPKEIGDNFYCDKCASLKSADLPATTKLKGRILK